MVSGFYGQEILIVSVVGSGVAKNLPSIGGPGGLTSMGAPAFCIICNVKKNCCCNTYVSQIVTKS